jgi:hypothetical protein
MKKSIVLDGFKLYCPLVGHFGTSTDAMDDDKIRTTLLLITKLNVTDDVDVFVWDDVMIFISFV